MSRLMVFLLSVLALGTVRAAAPAVMPPTLLVFGDSLSAGYGIDPARGWVRLLEQRLRDSGHDYRVVNASVSGETTAGGLARLPRALQIQHPSLVILELGGNDGLRALPVDAMRDNLGRMLQLCRSQRVPVLLVGIRMPANYGPRFTGEFAAVYGQLAARFAVPLVPYLLAGVADHPAWMQADGIHPNEQGQPQVLENLWPQLQKMLTAAPMRRKAA